MLDLSIDDLFDLISESTMSPEQRLWLLKNLKHVRTKYVERFGEDVRIQ